MSKLAWGLTVGGVALAAAAVERLSPRPAVAVIRWFFDRGASSCRREMELYSRAEPTAARRGVRYGLAKEKTRYDVFRPEGPVVARPTVVWIHGGAWVSGGRADVEPYLRDLAAEGFTTVGVDYTLAPAAGYPAPVRQVADALRHLVSNAAELGVDPDRIVLAGDSAGAQLASQLAAVITDSRTAATVGVAAPLQASQLVGVVLHCGIYDLAAIGRRRSILEWGFRKVLQAYTGSRDGVPGMSTLDFAAGSFPPAFVSGGDADPLTATQSEPFARRLHGLGVEVDTLFWPAGTGLPHEYQFHAHLPESRTAFEASVRFLNGVVAESRKSVTKK